MKRIISVASLFFILLIICHHLFTLNSALEGNWKSPWTRLTANPSSIPTVSKASDGLMINYGQPSGMYLKVQAEEPMLPNEICPFKIPCGEYHGSLIEGIITKEIPEYGDGDRIYNLLIKRGSSTNQALKLLSDYKDQKKHSDRAKFLASLKRMEQEGKCPYQLPCEEYYGSRIQELYEKEPRNAEEAFKQTLEIENLLKKRKDQASVPNRADPKERWLICCDNQGNFYSKHSNKIITHQGQMSADGETFMNVGFCLTNDYPFKDGSDPTYQDCILGLAYTKNFNDSVKGSMYD